MDQFITQKKPRWGGNSNGFDFYLGRGPIPSLNLIIAQYSDAKVQAASWFPA